MWVVVLGLLMGCVTAGKEFDTTHVGDDVNGETTKAENLLVIRSTQSLSALSPTYGARLL